MNRRLVPALVAWAVSGCGVDGACPICDEPVDTDSCVPGDWTFEDGVCSGCRPVPECLERKMGVESPRDVDSIVCSEHADCDAGSFCGAGYCRPAEEEHVTLCIEEGWFVGDALPDQGTPPDFVVILFELYSYYGPYYSIGTGHAPDTCHPKWNHCFVYPLVRAADDTLLVRQSSRVDNIDIQYASLVSGGNEAEQLGRLVDQGCQAIRRGDVLEDGNMTVWFSVWYP